MVRVTVELPPRGTFFHLALTTGLMYIQAYADPSEIPSVSAQRMTLIIPDDQRLANAISDFVNDLSNGLYGLPPDLQVDRKQKKLENLIQFLSKATGEKIEARAKDLLQAYAKYVGKLAAQGRLLSELEASLNPFNNGYPNDAKIVEVPILSRLAPEFTEGIRVLGGVDFRSGVPERMKSSKNLTIGLHSACIGLLGIWASLVSEVRKKGKEKREKIEYFVFPSLVLAGGSAGDVKRVHKKVLSSLKRCVPTSVAAQALAIALCTAGEPVRIRGFELAVVGESANRLDLYEQGSPLSVEALMRFADELKHRAEERGRHTHKALLTLAICALTEPSAKQREIRELEQKLRDIGLKVSQLLFMSLTGALGSENLSYMLARLLYAHSDERLEGFARERGAMLYPSDVKLIVEAVEAVSGRATP